MVISNSYLGGGGDKGFISRPENERNNAIEIELAYYDVAVHHINHYSIADLIF